MFDILGKINGKLTGPSLVLIALFVILNQLGVTGHIPQADSLQVETALTLMNERITMEHDRQLEVTKEIATELKVLASTNKDMLHILRDIKVAADRLDRRSGP